MPILPPTGPQPYDTVETVLHFARIFANDAFESMDGELLSDTQPYIYTFLNSGWRDLQDELANSGAETFYAEAELTGVFISATTDPGIFNWIGFASSFDGSNSQTGTLLPSDLIMPLRLWERRSGQSGSFCEMRQADDGLESFQKGARQGCWEWRNDRIYIPGATQSVDLRIRYNRYLADIAPSPTATIPLLRCAKTLAYYLVAEWAAARGSLQVDAIKAQAAASAQQMIARTARRSQRTNHRRRPYSQPRGWM